MNQLIPLETGAANISLLENINAVTENYFRYKLFKDDSLNVLPYF